MRNILNDSGYLETQLIANNQIFANRIFIVEILCSRTFGQHDGIGIGKGSFGNAFYERKGEDFEKFLVRE